MCFVTLFCNVLICFVTGEADGETGVLNKAVESAVLCRQLVVRNAADYYNYCCANLKKDTPTSKREFVFVDGDGVINRDRPESEVLPVPGCRKLHQVVKVAPLTFKARHLACICCFCLDGRNLDCPNKEYTGQFQVVSLKVYYLFFFLFILMV
jgi:hypothetical protein